VLDDEIYLGASERGAATSAPQRSVLVLGPSRSGKTSSLIVPNLLLSSRAVVTTSTKDDVLRTVARARPDRATMLFDPSGTVDVPPGVVRVGYSPLTASATWDGAVLAARSLVEAARHGRPDRADDHWTERASAMVAPIMHAAALRHASIGALVSAVDQRHGEDALSELRERYGAEHPAASLLGGVLSAEERELSSIWSTASGLFAGLRTEAARRASRERPLSVAEFLAQGHHLHIVAPSRHQGVTAPLVIGLIDELVDATYQGHQRGARLLLAFDELANVAPLPRLARVVSEGGGQGVLTLASLQDLSQARARWGTAADGFLSLFPTTVVLPGIADKDTLELVRTLAGRGLEPSPTIHRDRHGRRTGHTTSWVERDRLSAAEIARGRPGFALALDESKRARWVHLTPAHEDARFARYLSQVPMARSLDRESVRR
jgi:type IV secretion system protein VirD4